MTMQELAVLKQEHIDVKVAIINNGHLGMIRQWQSLFYNERFIGARLLNPDFVKLAEAYNLPAVRAATKEETLAALKRAREIRGPVILDLVVEETEKVYPMVPPGSSLAETIEAETVAT